MVGCDSPHRVTAHVVERDGDRIETRAVITDLAANVCVEAGATFVAIGEATAQEIVSEEIAPEHRSFLAED